MTTESGLKIIDTTVGTGASPKTGQTCVMHYTGWLYTNGIKGKKVDSSVDRGEPFEIACIVRLELTLDDVGGAQAVGSPQVDCGNVWRYRFASCAR